MYIFNFNRFQFFFWMFQSLHWPWTGKICMSMQDRRHMDKLQEAQRRYNHSLALSPYGRQEWSLVWCFWQTPSLWIIPDHPHQSGTYEVGGQDPSPHQGTLCHHQGTCQSADVPWLIRVWPRPRDRTETGECKNVAQMSWPTFAFQHLAMLLSSTLITVISCKSTVVFALERFEF